MDDGDAGLLRLADMGEMHRLPPPKDLSGIPLIDPGQDFHQGRLARPIFPDQGHDPTRVDLEIHLVQDLVSGKGFVNPLHVKDRLFPHGCPPKNQHRIAG